MYVNKKHNLHKHNTGNFDTINLSMNYFVI